MRAIKYSDYGNPNVLKICDISEPTINDDNLVKIKVHFAGLNRPDLMQRQGKYPPPFNATDILGLEVSGEIVEIGSKVKKWNVGDLVCALTNGGGYSEFVITYETHCMPIPKNLSLLEASGIPETFLTVWNNVFYRGKLKEEEIILVHGGASGIGTTAVQLAKNMGSRVFATAGNDEKCRFVEELGAEKCINYKNENFSEMLLDFTLGKGANMILDMVGGIYLEKNLTALSIEGRLIIIAVQGGTKSEIDLAKLMVKRQTIFGTTLRPQSPEMKAKYVSDFLDKGWKLLDNGKIKPIIHKCIPLEDASLAHTLLEEGNHIGKFILKVMK